MRTKSVTYKGKPGLRKKAGQIKRKILKLIGKSYYPLTPEFFLSLALVQRGYEGIYTTRENAKNQLLPSLRAILKICVENKNDLKFKNFLYSLQGSSDEVGKKYFFELFSELF